MTAQVDDNQMVVLMIMVMVLLRPHSTSYLLLAIMKKHRPE